MKKTFYIIALGLLGLVGFTRADVNSINVAPALQQAISGSLATFTVAVNNGSGDMYLKYVLPQTATYNIMYRNASITPLNNALLTLGIEHDPVFAVPANTNFSVTVTAKNIMNNRVIPTVNTTAIIAADMQFSTVLTSAVAQLFPVADLVVTNVLTGNNPLSSGDNVSYYITLKNIGSYYATGIAFISTFPIPTLSSPSATFDGTPRAYSYINYPQDFVRTGTYLNMLNAGQTMTIMLNAQLTQSFPIGTPFTQIAKVTTPSIEYSTGNNSATATGVVQSAADLRITKTLILPFTGYESGTPVPYRITYGNSGGRAADNVIIDDYIPPMISVATLHLPTGIFPMKIGTLPAGSGGSFILTATLASLLSSGQVFLNVATISTTSAESTTGNNSSTATGIIQGHSDITIDIKANNFTKPQFDNPPYGSGPNLLIQAVDGDAVQLTITYANNGNAVLNNAVMTLTGIQGFTSDQKYNDKTLGTIGPNMSGTITIGGRVSPRNYISFTPTARLTYNGNQSVSDSMTIQEPFVCGDGLLTRNEPCDTLGNLGVLYSGQVCENQQGMCVLVTQSIINNACINYQYNNPLGGILTGQSCSSVNIALSNASCSTMTGSGPIPNANGYSVNMTCRGNNTTPSTPISIDCGNGTTISGSGAMFNGTCSYASGFVGNAQGRVGNDANNSACRVPVSINGGQCRSLDALDGTIAIVDENGDADSTFRCTTTNGATAQKITIDCGNGTQHTANNVSVFEAGCRYTNVPIPQTYNVRCTVDGSTAPACQQNLIVDKAFLGYCGNGIREGYEDCDDGDLNGTSSSNCTKGCDLKNSGLVGCFSIGNTNISIQKGDLLPFRWTLDANKNIIAGSTCENKPDGKIPTDSIYCTFGIYNGDTSQDNDPLYTVKKRCNENNRGNMSLFSYFLGQQNVLGTLKNAFGKYYIPSDDFVTDTFGEYKIVLDKVEYQYCRSDDKTEGTEIDRVCSVNFTVTQPYLAQKSSFGLTPKATNIKLDGYKMLNGDELIKSTDLEDIMILDESNYDGGNKVQAMINTFITKYDKLALTVPQSSLKNTAFDGLDITVKVVPQQKIYLLESDTKKTITMKNIKSFTAPFTIVTKNIDIIIKGNVEYNGMFLVKGGTITFEKSDATLGGDRCPSTQIVKGIFVTDEGFLGGEKLTNTDTSKQRCNYGGLYVKGILIGNDIENIVEAKRSQLNHRFRVGGTSDAAIKAERRNEIFNGAAVLIEYSPSLRSALPPGASEFTKALEIYKQ